MQSKAKALARYSANSRQGFGQSDKKNKELGCILQSGKKGFAASQIRIQDEKDSLSGAVHHLENKDLGVISDDFSGKTQHT